VVFDNDAVIDGKDRNLYVQSIELNGEVISTQDDNVTYIRSDGSEYAYNGTMWWKGALIFDIPDIQRQIIVVNVKGSEAGGIFSHFRVKANGIEIGESHTTSSYQNYSFIAPFNLGKIMHVNIIFDNDAVFNGSDRNLYVRSIVIDGEEIPAPGYNVFYKRTNEQYVEYTGMMPWNGVLIFDLDLGSIICEGDITLASQEAVDNFTCKEILGSLTISGTDIKNLYTLSGLTKVNWLNIFDNPALTNLNGLSGLEKVNTIEISNNDALLNLDGLSTQIASVQMVNIYNNKELNDLDGLSGIFSINTLQISDNISLRNIDGLSEFTSIDLLTIENASIEDLNGLTGLTLVETLQLIDNNQLKNLDGLSGLDELYTLKIINNDALPNLNGLPNLSNTIFMIDIVENDALTNIDGLSDLLSIDNLYIFGNRSLTNIDGLSRLTTFKSLQIINNELLNNLDGLSSLLVIQDNLLVYENPSSNSCCGLYPLLNSGGVSGTIDISNNGAGCTEADILAHCPGTGELIVNAKSTPAGGVYAHFKVLVDGQEIGNKYTTSGYMPYTFTLSQYPTTIEEVKVVFDNDAVINGMDRNLYVMGVEVDGTNFPAPAGNVTYIRGDGSEYPYHGTMWWKGELIFDLSEMINALVRKTSSVNITDFCFETENNFLKMSIYPNPAEQHFEVDIKNASGESCKLFLHDLTGKIVFTDDFMTHEQVEVKTVDTSIFPSGLYILKLVAGNNQSVQEKLIIK
jgi:hypothetical protein